jgi:hypothetical protein
MAAKATQTNKRVADISFPPEPNEGLALAEGGGKRSLR